jgi:hypothetical protein
MPGAAGDRYARLVDTLTRSERDVAHPTAGSETSRGFGAGALKVDGRIFAMLSRDRLVVKLPRARVDELLAAGRGERFDPGHGRLMREWLHLFEGEGDDWESLAREALAFGRAQRAG